ncbi:MAG: polyphosphate kinase 1 [Treponema sp.]|jgi:polyphosphate kinase|nr:polyphosphate kinase 1 [Treponema sp.]
MEQRYLSRDLSWIDFNRRVMEEGLRKDLAPLERFRFLSIVSSNFDEFFMVRVAGLKRALRSAGASDPSRRSPAEQLKAVSHKARSTISEQYRCLAEEVFPALARGGLTLCRPASYTAEQRDYLYAYFMSQVYPLLTPLRIEDEKALPSIDSFSMNAALLLAPEQGDPILDVRLGERADTYMAMVRLPPALPRLVRLPAAPESACLALLEDLLLTWAGALFPGLRVVEALLFKVNRDADFSVDEQRDEDFIEAMEEVLEGRESSMAVRMVYAPPGGRLRDELARRLSLEGDDLYPMDPLDLGGLIELANIPGFDHLREKPRRIYPAFGGDESIWDTIRAGDLMIHLPYHSFDPVVRFFQEAAADPQVLSIKTALYRTSGNSPIVRALEDAALKGKHVTALVELKARFDEERNISWANELEKAGAIVVYGLARLKVHAKITLVIRREGDRMNRYVHLATGNYNDKTARLYEDVGLFTCREDIAFDAGLIFNMITGYSAIEPMRKLVIAPTSLKHRLVELINREANRSNPETPGRIMVKLNSLADTDVIEALYRASQAGVRVLLCVRGVCTLIPGEPGLSENIQVRGLIDRYLEHSRIYYFANGGAEELYLSSADWMPRNLERRVELMFPVLQDDIRQRLKHTLEAYFRDNTQAWSQERGGDWKRLGPAPGESPFRVQEYLLSRAAADSPETVRTEFTVRRSPPGDIIPTST